MTAQYSKTYTKTCDILPGTKPVQHDFNISCLYLHLCLPVAFNYADDCIL